MLCFKVEHAVVILVGEVRDKTVTKVGDKTVSKAGDKTVTKAEDKTVTKAEDVLQNVKTRLQKLKDTVTSKANVLVVVQCYSTGSWCLLFNEIS